MSRYKSQMAKADGVLDTQSWTEGGAYSRPRPSSAVIAQCQPYRFNSIAEISAEAAASDKAP